MKKVTKLIIVLIFLISGVNVALAKKEIKIISPNKRVTVSVNTEGRLSYSINSYGTQVLATSPLGIVVDSIDLGCGAKIVSNPSFTNIDENYPIFGNHSMAKNHANEAVIPIQTAGKIFNLIVRVYNDGVAVRYTLPKGSIHIDSEYTSWNLPEKTKKVAWSGFSQGYEDLSHVTTVGEIPQNKPVMGPITFEVEGHFLSISEADCETFSDMAFVRNGNLLKATFPFATSGWNIKLKTDDSASVLKGTYLGYSVSPWRTTIVTRNLTDLINSDLLMNLCPAPSKNLDFSWVQPGRCLWQWWSVGSPKFDDQKNWYDAAAKLKWEYYLVDDGWRNWSKPDKDQWMLLKEVITYGKSVGVKSIVWVDSKEMRDADKRRSYLEKIKALGASGIKIDFIPKPTPEIMQWYMGAMHDCAELQLLLNFHGSVKPTGLRRTYPNDITREAVRGNEYHMTRYKRVTPYEQDVCLPFTRLMAGAADITPVILDPGQLSTQKFTWAHEFAQAIIYLSPITHFADQYKFYLESPMLDLFQSIPTTWDETMVISCTNMGEVVAYARRKGDTWWIGAMNGATDREIKIPLDFLKKPTQATLIYDDQLINTSIDRREQKLRPNDTLTIKLVPGGGFAAMLCCAEVQAQESYSSPIRPINEPIAAGMFQPSWQSLSQYKVPDWYRNAKFGIWAHWGPQCQPGQGDWYARFMYNEGSRQYKWQVEHYGHPSKAGFKEVINSWKAEKWNPEKLVALYKRAGAQYFFAMANHHDNLDMWNSKYQQWNTVNVGPHKDILAGWAKAAKDNHLPFGLSVHAAHAWSWYEVAQRSDKKGELVGVPYDGNLTKADGKGTWWEGLDPQELYAQNHPLSEGSDNVNKIHSQWNWGNGVSIPSQEYCEKFYNRTVDMINQFHPDLLYFDDTTLPLYPISDAGLKIAAHFYNSNMMLHNGKLEAVLFGKILTPDQKKSLVWDVERGAPDKIQDLPWQTCSCIGGWHYSIPDYENNRYKSAKDVIHMLIDVVSKNGNLLLNVPIRGDGTIDEKEVAVIEGIATWMDINKESIFDTRPWRMFGEGPAADAKNPINVQGFNEGKIKFSSKDIRFNQKGNVLYVTVMGAPDANVVVENLKADRKNRIRNIELLGSKEKIKWSQNSDHLTIEKPNRIPNPIAIVFKIYQK
ncbi:MAG TPA: alpha-L-fucosidase [Bacteroidales bacterium]|nr:alpha-L-fucosidase [Bacteroidales bacterium]